MRSILLLLVLVVSFVSCKKDEPTSTSFCIENNCKPIQDSKSGMGWGFVNSDNYYISPCYNPLDSNVFLFVDFSNNLELPELCIYSFLTGKAKRIFQGNIASRPKWGKNNWIVFTLSDNNIWKIKSNGDSLVKLTYTGSCYNPTWNFESTEIWYYSPDIQRAIRLTENGAYLNTIEKLPYGATNIAFINDSIIVSNNYVGVGIFNLKSGEFDVLSNADITSFSGSAYIPSLMNIIWAHKSGIHLTGIVDNIPSRCIYPSCDSRRYIIPTISGDSQKIIFQLLIKTPLDKQYLKVESRIVYLDIPSLCVKEIPIEF